MAAINNANLPESCVKLAIVDGRLSRKFKSRFSELGLKIIWTLRHPVLYEAVSYHPDMFMCHVGGENIVYAPLTPEYFVSQLEENGFNMIKGHSELSGTYPHSCAYNVLIAGKYAFHRKDITDPVILEYLKESNITLVHVKQGYSKCSTCVVDENSVITQDKGIFDECEKNGVEALFLYPEKSILLPGLNYGFVGGCCGKTGKFTMLFTGSIKSLNQGKQIGDFLKQRNISLVELSDEVLIDAGTIIPLMI